MPYYGQGDYYGQGGFGSFIGGLVRGAVGLATGGPLGAIAAVTRKKAVAPGTVMQAPGVIPAIQRIVPGGATGLKVAPGTVDPATGMVRPKRRRMNYANGRALTRANRRVDGFVKLARRSLKHTNYRIVSKSAGKRSAPVTIRESGPGSVISRG